MSARKCPHCGGLVESDVPAGWIMVPLVQWNKLVLENRYFKEAGKACGEAKRLAARAKALWAASQIMEAAATGLDAVVESLDEETAGEPPDEGGQG